jgi:hypothetical protein
LPDGSPERGSLALTTITSAPKALASTTTEGAARSGRSPSFGQEPFVEWRDDAINGDVFGSNILIHTHPETRGRKLPKIERYITSPFPVCWRSMT